MRILDLKCRTTTRLIPLLVTVACIGFTGTKARGADFSFGYNYVYASGADAYLVDQTNVRKYSEWQSPPTTYWGPSANDTTGTLSYAFNFQQPTTNIFLNVSLASFNFVWGNAHGYFGSGTGSSSLWASTDGSSWQLLLDNPMPVNGVDSYMTYNQNVPASLLGNTSFWIQVRMVVDNAPNSSYTDAQFSRSSSAATNNIFEIDVSEIPEPSPVALVAGAFGCLLLMHRRNP